VRRPEALRILAPLLAAAFIFPALADDTPQQQLDAVGKAMKQSQAQHDAATSAAASLAAEIADLRGQAIAAAGAAQADEAALAAANLRLGALAATAADKRAALDRDSRHETALLMALLRASAAPPALAVVAPETPVDALRSALVMAHAVPPLEARTATLRRDIDAAETAERDLSAAEAEAARKRADLAGEQATLAALIARKSELQQEATRTADETGKRLVALAAQSASLHELIERLDAERRKSEAEAERRKHEAEAAPPDIAPAPADTVAVTAPAPVRLDPSAPRRVRPFAEARGAMAYPASGTLVLRFGAPDEYGGTNRGLTFATEPGAVVVAPFDGQIAFAGPFRSYGQILIIAHGDGYHSLLAGLDRIDVSAGQTLIAGEPVGRMPDGEGKPHLYFELRHDNQPINPMPWLATRLEKVNG